MRRAHLRWWSSFLTLLLVCAPALTVSAASKKKPRRRAVRYSIPSYGNPTANDNLAGENAAVRAAAAEALGRYNGSVVVVEADTGRVLSIVNQELALSSGFKPCSTIKVAVGWGALQEGLISGETVLRVSRYKSINLSEALAYSDNTFFEKLGEQMGFEKVSAYARLLGFGELAGYMIENEYPGSFPTAPPANGGVARMSSYGEDIKVTPLQLAAQMGAFANSGTLYYLQYPQSEEEQLAFRPRIKRLLPLQAWLPDLRAGMEGAVLYGTARNSNGGQEHMLGKTGTCGEDQAKLGWFASYGELSSGKRLAVVVLLRGGRVFNGGKAAEIAAEVYRSLGMSYELANYPESAPAAPASQSH